MKHPPSIEEIVGQKLMLAFEGTTPPAEILEAIAQRRLSGVTLSRRLNLENAAQLRALTAALQTAAAHHDLPPLLIAADHETGQLMGLGEELTPFPGNMALGATRDVELAAKVGRAMGLELAALGFNVNYAPVCDVNSNPQNPSIGVRSFGDDADLAAEMATALIHAMQQAGVAATAKHFPGLGDTIVDSHHAVPTLAHGRERLAQVDLRPFKAAIAAGVRLVMSGHVGVPALTGKPSLPATLSPAVMRDLLRDELGFTGVVISDAMEMGAIAQGAGQVIDAIAAVRAGVDLLLLNENPDVQKHVYGGLLQAVHRDLIGVDGLEKSAGRIARLKQWLAGRKQPDFELVGCAAHQALAREVSARALTLVRDTAGRLPLDLPGDASIGVILPRLDDLTPADSSSYLKHTLVEALRTHHPSVDEILVGRRPDAAEIAQIKTQAANYDWLLIGTISTNIQTEQAELVKALLALDIPTITVALRTPYDLMAYPQAQTHVCTYSLHAPAMQALAAALWGHIPFRGRLPVTLPDLESAR